MSALVLCGVAVLSGCTPSVSAPTPTPTSSSSSASPTADALTRPRSALPLSCAQILSLSELRSHLVDPVTVQIDETHAPRRLDEIAVLQVGGMQCAWGGRNMTDATWDTGVTLAVLPDATADFTAWEADPSAPHAVTGTLGDFSGLTCESTGDASGDWCAGDVLVGTSWISFTVDDIGGAAGAGVSTTATVIGAVVDAVRGAGPARSNWTPPTDAVTGIEFCTQSTTASEILGAPVGPIDADFAPAPDLALVASNRADVSGCDFTDASSRRFTVSTLPAGAWALPIVAAAPPLWTLLGRPTPFDVSGTDGALRACGDGCQALVSVGGSLLQVYDSQTGNDAQFALIVQKTAAAIRGV